MALVFYDCATAPSPRRARILLHEKQVAFESVEVDLRSGEQLSDAYRRINPNCTVPALKLEDGTVFTENAGIAAYLEAAFPEIPMLGVTAEEKGLVADWVAMVEFEGLLAVAEALRNSSSKLKGRALTGAKNFEQIPALAERGLQRLELFMQKIDSHLRGRDYAAIDQFSYADICAVVTIDFARVVGVSAGANYENILRWRNALKDRPSLQL